MTRYPARFPRPAALGALVLAAATALALSGCGGTSGSSDAASDYVTEGSFTVATGEPAYPPYVQDDDPESGEGFEAAVAYAVAEQLGFAEDEVVWVRTGFDQAIAPGPKDFDVNIQQFSISDERREAVDFSSPYYSTPQAVVTLAGSPAADATSLADLKSIVIGAAVGTTSFTVAEETIAPDTQVASYTSNDDAKAALQSGQVDALVVDLPTALYLRDAELDDGVVVGQLPASAGVSDDWGLLLAKDSPLTAEVTEAVDALREDGTLDDIAAEWLGADAGAPLLE